MAIPEFYKAGSRLLTFGSALGIPALLTCMHDNYGVFSTREINVAAIVSIIGAGAIHHSINRPGKGD